MPLAPVHPSTYWLDVDNRIVRVNAAWVAFARANDAADLEFLVIDRAFDSFVVGAHLAQLLRDVFDATRARRRPVELSYRCDSPGLRRVFDLRLTPTDDGLLECASWLREETPRAVPLPVTNVRETFSFDAAAFLTICSWCKHARCGTEWVEMHTLAATHRLLEIDPFPPISHGLCAACEQKLLDAAH